MNATLVLTLLLSTPSAHAPAGIKWERRFDEALKKAQAARKPVLVDFWAEWCGWCHRLDKTTYVDATVVKMAGGFVAVKVDTEAGAREADIARRYDVNSLPTIAFLTPYGRPLFRLTGYQSPSQFPRTLQKAQDMAVKVMPLEAAVERDPKDAEALAALGVHLFEQDAYPESGQLLQRAAQADGRRPLEERKQTRLLLGAILKSDEKFQEAETVLKAGLALQPDDSYDAKLLYVLGKLYGTWGRRDEGRAVLKKVVDQYPHTPIAPKAREALEYLNQKK